MSLSTKDCKNSNWSRQHVRANKEMLLIIKKFK